MAHAALNKIQLLPLKIFRRARMIFSQFAGRSGISQTLEMLNGYLKIKRPQTKAAEKHFFVSS